MAVTNTFNREIPAEDIADFTNGERAIAVNTVIGNEATGTYYLGKRIVLTPGVYNIKVMLSPGGTITIGGITITGTGLITTQIDVPVGEQRIDITLNKTSVEQLAYAAFLIFRSDKVIYTSHASGWVFDTAPLLYADIPPATDPRLDLPVFGVLPNWADGITERVMYLTDILASETGAEQRRALRQYPRRTIEAQFLRHTDMRARLDAFLVGMGRRDFLVPLWHEQYRITTQITPGQSYHQFPLDGDTLEVREFAVNDLVLITQGDPTKQEVLTVQAIDYTLGRITWKVAPVRTWPVGTRIIPLRRAVLVDKLSMNDPVDRVGRVTMRFELKDPMVGIEPDWGHCCPLWKFKPDWSEALTVDYDRITYLMDNESGPMIFSDPGNRALVGTRLKLTLFGRSSVLKVRKFVAAARGRAVRFYAPTFTQDVVPYTDLGGTYFDAEPMSFAEVMDVPQWARKIIAVKFHDGSPSIYRTVVGVSEQVTFGGKTVDRFVLDAELPPIPMSAIERIEFLVPSRFDQDGFEFKHMVDESAAVQLGVVLRSVDGDGMPPPDCWLTTPIYPVEAFDEMQPSFAMTAGRILQAPTPLDAMDVSFTFNSGDLREPLQTYNVAPEGMDASIALTAGYLGIAMQSVTVSPEAFDASVALTEGTLRVALLTNSLPAEAMDVSFALTAGTLS